MQRVYDLIQHVNFLRRPVGLFFLLLAILGFVLPVIPSWPFVVPAVILLGRRDRALRHTHLLLRRSLRILRRSQTNWIRIIGRRLSDEYVKVRRMLTPMICAAERNFRLS
jgi:hypothetical protein